MALFLLGSVDGRHGLLPGARHGQAAQALSRAELRRAGQRRRRYGRDGGRDGLGGSGRSMMYQPNDDLMYQPSKNQWFNQMMMGIFGFWIGKP